MNPNPIILEISSDEEDDGVWGERNEDDQIDWLSVLWNSIESINDDSDEVVFMGEVSGSSIKQSKKILDMKKPAVVGDDSDDDCLILDKDPDNPVAVENDTDNNGSDELLIVSEKGQIACRDYPHSRDQCARFPFKTSPHEKYCDMCHCYVCDSRAPCKYWEIGNSKTDHCHATSNEEIWKTQRKIFKQSGTIPLKKLHVMTSSIALPAFQKSAPTLSFSPLSASSTINAVSSCLPTSNFGVPGIINRGNTLHPRLVQLPMGRNGFPHHVSSRSQLIPRGVTSNHKINRRERDRGGVTLSPHSHATFKRAGSVDVGVLPKNRCTNSSSNHYNNHAQKSQTKRMYQHQPPSKLLNETGNNQKCQNFVRAIDSTRDTSYKNVSKPTPTINNNSTDVVYSSQFNDNMQNMYSVQNSFSNVMDPNSQDFDFSWGNKTSTVNPFPLVDGSEIPGLQPSTAPLLPDGSTDPFYSSPNEINVNPTGQTELDNWFDSLVNQSDFGPASNDTVPSQSDFVSSQADLMDENLFVLDFENC